MVWLSVCSRVVSPIVIFDEGTIDHAPYIGEVLPIALKYGNDILGKPIGHFKKMTQYLMSII